ncbi:MAG: pyridoxamine 5'-phosphate oxidase family protein [Vicinamibacteria bacterium]
MLSDDVILRHLEPGRSILVGTVDPSGWPAACRGLCLVVDDDRQGFTVYVPVATGAETVANIASNGRVAVAATEPASHTSIQLKGRTRAVRVARSDEEERVRLSLDRFADSLDLVGLPRGVTRTMTCWPAFAIEVAVEAVFDQTPGPRAGALVRGR